MKSILLTALILLVSWPTAIAQTAKITKSITPLATTPPALPDTPIIWDNAGTLTLRDDTGVDWMLSGVDFTSLSVAEITAITQAIDYSQLTAAQITAITQAIDYSQLTAAQITAITQAIDYSQLTAAQITAITQAIDYSQLTATQVTELTQAIDFTQLTAAQITALEAALGLSDLHPDDDVEGVTGTAVDNTDPRNPIINVSANDHPDDDVEGVTGTAVDNTDSRNPIINVSANDHPDDDVEGVTGTAVDNTDPRNPIIDLTPTDLAYSPSPTNGVVTSSDGTNATLPLATVTNAGLITPAEKANIHADDDVEGVTGNLVDNTDARNPIVNAAVSADAEQLLKLGADSLAMLDPDDLVSTDASNIIVKGTDGKLHAVAAAGFVGTAGSVPFSNGTALTEDNANLFFNNATNRLGVGTNAPSATLDLVGAFQYTDGNQSANRVLTSDASGNATWQAPATGGNIVTSDNTQTADRAQDFANFNQTWTNGSTWSVDSNFFSFVTNPSTTANRSTLDMNANAATLKRDGTGSLVTSVTVDLGKAAIEWDSGSRINRVAADQFGIELSIATGDDLQINNAPGTSGQQITSQGSAATPIWGAASDERIKRDIKDVPSAVDILANIEIKSFKFRDEDKTNFGVVAQQVKEHLPELIDNSQTSTDLDGNEIDIHTVDYQSLFSLSIQAIKELKAEVEELKLKLQ